MVMGKEKKGPFESHHRCACGARIKCFVDNPWFKRDEPCVDCGSDAYSWELVTERWVSTCVWYRPDTWGSGYYEEPS